MSVLLLDGLEERAGLTEDCLLASDPLPDQQEQMVVDLMGEREREILKMNDVADKFMFGAAS